MEYFDRGGKHAVWVVHRRGGKDLTSMHQTCKMMHRRRGQYWHVYPTFSQARKAIWEGFTSDGDRIIDLVFPGEVVRRRNDHEMVIELKCGSIWRLLGSDKIEVVGAGPIGVVFSEYAVAKPRAAELISPMLMQNGGWESYITTPRGNNHAKKLYDTALRNRPEWFAELQTLFDTRTYDPERTIAAERSRGKPDGLIRQEYLCDWTAANVGSVFGDLIERLEKAGAMAEFDHPRDGVFTAWDLGFTDSTAIWWWRWNGDGLDFVDHYEAHGKPLSHYFDEVDKRGYQVVQHWLPHDARAQHLGAQTVEDQFRARYPGHVQIGPRESLLDGVQAGRWLLERATRFHPRTAAGIEALRSYHYEWDEDTKTYGRKPEHDWSSHTADAFRYAAVVARHTGLMMKPEEEKAPPEIGPHDGAWNLDKLFSDHEEGLI